MAEYIIQGETLTGIANAIRSKTGNSDAITPGDMATQISNIQGTGMDTSDIEPEIVAEANRVANSVANKMTSNSITFIAMSDMHEMGDQDHSDTGLIERYRLANKQAAQAAAIIADKIPIDFFANLGDFAYGILNGDNRTTPYDWINSISNAKEYLSIINKVDDIFLIPGNHDALYNWYDYQNAYVTNDLVTGLIGDFKSTDFENQKVRVIALNTSERITVDDTVCNMSDDQLYKFATALDLSSKGSDMSNWNIIILSHFPIGSTPQSAARDISDPVPILQAYKDGGTVAIGDTTYDYNGRNGATIIGNFHGHTHCYKHGNIIASADILTGNYEKQNGETGSYIILDEKSQNTIQLPYKRIAIPNACHGRNNEYGRGGNWIYGEKDIYTCPNGSSVKSDIFGENTAFCVVTIDLDNGIIYADCFGSLGDTEVTSLTDATRYTHAGYDRVISYKEEDNTVWFEISKNLENINSSNSLSIIKEDTNYETVLSPIDNNYKLDPNSVTITMGGIDITNDCYNEETGEILIEKVTGNIIITAIAIRYTNYTITNDLINVENSNNITEISSTSSYEAVLTPTTGYSIGFYRVLMGNTDITETVCIEDSGTININIEEINGDIYIIAGNYNNLITTSTAVNGETIYNEIGYKNNTYISSGGSYGEKTGIVATGYIKATKGTKVYLKGAKISTDDKVRIYTYRSISESGVSNLYLSGGGTADFETGIWSDASVNKNTVVQDLLELGENYYSFTFPDFNVNEFWYRMSLEGTGEKLVITHDQEISEINSYLVTNILTGVTNSNTANTTMKDGTYEATLSPKTDYKINYETKPESVTITMGGKDITSECYTNNDDGTGTISILQVTGNIIITVVAEYIGENVVRIAQSLDSEEIYNTNGYKDNIHITDSESKNFEDSSDYTVGTGWIPYTVPDVGLPDTIIIQGAEWTIGEDYTTQGDCRLYFFDQTKSTVCVPLITSKSGNLSTYYTIEKMKDDDGNELEDYFKLIPIAEDGNWSALKLPGSNSANKIRYFRISLEGKGKNLSISLVSNKQS